MLLFRTSTPYLLERLRVVGLAINTWLGRQSNAQLTDYCWIAISFFPCNHDSLAYIIVRHRDLRASKSVVQRVISPALKNRVVSITRNGSRRGHKGQRWYSALTAGKEGCSCGKCSITGPESKWSCPPMRVFLGSFVLFFIYSVSIKESSNFMQHFFLHVLMCLNSRTNLRSVSFFECSFFCNIERSITSCSPSRCMGRRLCVPPKEQNLNEQRPESSSCIESSFVFYTTL